MRLKAFLTVGMILLTSFFAANLSAYPKNSENTAGQQIPEQTQIIQFVYYSEDGTFLFESQEFVGVFSDEEINQLSKKCLSDYFASNN